MSRRGAWNRWISLLLRAYPRAFRARFGRDLAAQYGERDDRGVLAVAMIASYVPARRAMRIDPVIALRAD